MNIKKIIGSALAFALASGVFAALPSSYAPFDTAISASAETTKSGFVLETDEDGDTYIAGYEGKGGKIVIPSGVSYIDANAFKDNTAITSVTFPKGTTTYGIGSGAFAGCTDLKTVIIEGDCAFVGEGAFRNCVSLKTVSFGGNVEYDKQGGIFANAFRQCQSLKTVAFGKSDALVDFIGDRAFMNCYFLASVNLPSGLGSVGDDAFANCVKLKDAAVPAGTALGKYSFGYMAAYASKAEASAALEKGADKDAKHYRADGVKTAYREYYSVNKETGGLDVSVKAVKQPAITLALTAGSPAEKWAEKYKISYTSRAAGENGLLSAPENFRAKKSENKIVISWDAVEGAAGYKVYKYNAETKKYEKYKSVTGTSCTVTGLESGTKYKFKAAALEKSGDKYIMGNMSETITVKTAGEAKKYPSLTLSAEAKEKLRKDYAKAKGGKAENIYVHAYFGTYGGCEAVVMWDKTKPATFDMKYVTAGNTTIAVGSGSFELCLHKGSKFIAIEKAYEKGYITDEDAAAMYYYSSEEEAYSFAE